MTRKQLKKKNKTTRSRTQTLCIDIKWEFSDVELSVAIRTSKSSVQHIYY